jgi:hypothetical protein
MLLSSQGKPSQCQVLALSLQYDVTVAHKDAAGETDVDEYSILKWAAGSVKSLPHRLDFDEDTLIDLVALHNMSGRFMRRLAEQARPWITPKLREAVQDLHSKTRLQVFKNATAMRQISGQLPHPVGVIIIKGMSTYILSKQEHAMRCGDIDVFSSDSAALVQTLTEMGYRQSKAPFLYELGEYSKEGIEIDVHSYFPIYSYSESLMSAELKPDSHPHIWRQSYRMHQQRIAYDDLRSDAYRSSALETEGITVPDPNMLALILCSHAFLNYTNMWSISHREKACVRLSEIADLFDLSAHPAFRSAKFLSLVKQFSAKDAVEWAASVAASLFGRNPLPVPGSVRLDDDLPDGRFPRCLWWDFWVNLRTGTDELLQRWWLPMGALTTQLGANTLAAVQDCTGKYSTINTDSSTLLRRLLMLAADEAPIPLELEVSKSERGIRIDLQVMSTLKDDINRVRVDFGHVASEWIHAESRQSLIGAPAIADFIDRGAKHRLIMEFSWKILGQSFQTRREIPMLVGVAKQSPDDELIASTLIPLKLCFES